MTESHVVRLIALYRTALKLLAVSAALAIVSIIAQTAVSTFKVFIPFVIGGGVFNPYIPLVVDLIALPGLIWLYRRAQGLQFLTPEAAAASYEKIWSFQQLIGTLVSLGAIIMIPGSIFAIQMGLPGLAILVPVFSVHGCFRKHEKSTEKL